MDQFLKLLFQEVGLLRELLSILAIEENAILNGNPPLFEKCYQDLIELRLQLRSVRKVRQLLQKDKDLSAEQLEEQTLFSQLKLLEETIKRQSTANDSLKKTSFGSNAHLLVEEEEKTPPKRRLLLEEDPG